MNPFIILICALALFALVFLLLDWQAQRKINANLALLTGDAPILTENGHTFRDLNKNGKFDPYEDSRLPVDVRVEDLLSQMTLEEKAGLMFHPVVGMNKDGSLLEKGMGINFKPTSELLIQKKLNQFNVNQIAASLKQTAEWHNRLQKMAERTRLGIPVTISSDPRHAFAMMVATTLYTEGFSHWPEPIGLAATRDPQLVQQFADMARQEYLSIGIRMALHPMADLATEPRWARCNGTFGEDAALSAQMLGAYIRGFQGEKLGPQSVACMTKHFPGGGPQKDGEDPHFHYGKDQVYPGNNFNYHLQPFDAAFAAGTAQIMPYYGRPLGQGVEEVGFGYNKEIITVLLRGKYGFEGVVCTDWGLIYGMKFFNRIIVPAKAWGVETLSPLERVKKVIEAGCDQFGGERCPELVVELVKSGQVSEERINQSARRILRDKFRLGLFDNPYLEVDKVSEIAGRSDFVAAGELAQRKSIALLKNTGILPLRNNKPRIYIENIDPAIASQYGEVVQFPEKADFAILRLKAPFEKRKGFLERMFHAGALDFKGEQLAHILDVCAKAPTIVDIYLDRPAVIPEIAAQCAGLLADFGARDAAVLDVIFGKFSPTGKLPFELPSSMEAVRKQKEDMPYDSENPLFPFGHGLSYPGTKKSAPSD